LKFQQPPSTLTRRIKEVRGKEGVVVVFGVYVVVELFVEFMLS